MISTRDLYFALDSTDSVVVMTDLEGKITYVNKAFEITYGYTTEEAIGKSTSILNSGYHDNDFYQDLWEFIRSGKTWEGVFRNKTKDGSLIWEKARISPIKNSENEHTGYVAVKEDISYKLNLEEQIQKEQFLLNELFSNAPIGITINEPIYANEEIVDVMILKANSMASSILNRMGLVGLKYSMLNEALKKQIKQVSEFLKQKQSFEQYLPDIDRHLSVRTFPIDSTHFCTLFFDITDQKNSIRALKESEERYASLVEDTPVLICRFNQEGTLNYANQQFVKTFKAISEGGVVGKSFFNFFSSDVISDMWSKIQMLSADISLIDFENKMEIGNEIRWQKWIIRWLGVNMESGVEFQAVGMDFTDLKKAEQELAENRNTLNAIVNSDNIGIGVVNTEGIFVHVNPHFCDMLGYEEVELINIMTNEAITASESLDLSKLMLDQVLEGDIPSCNIEKKYLRKDGTEFWGSVYLSPIKDGLGDIIEVVGIVADINEKKIIEMQIFENEQKLKELNEMKDRLFSIIAHDIKNPFGVVLGFSNILSEGLDELPKEKVKEYVNQILTSGEDTYKLLEDLLTWGRAQMNKLEINPEAVVLKQVVDKVYNYYSHLAKNKNIELKNGLSSELTVYADVDTITFVIRNLVHNAIKFTNKGGVIECFEELSNKQDKKAFVVKDSGIGINNNKLKDLFNINTYVSTTGTDNEKGTGLGLSLMKEMIDKNNGKVTVESIVNEGTSFIVELPMANNN